MSLGNSFKIELYNPNGALQARLDNIITDCRWEWLRVGGCGAGSLRLRTDFDSDIAQLLSEDSEVRIYLPGATSADLWYSGYVDKVMPSVTGGDESITISVLGYVNQLKRVIVREKEYTGNEISTVAQDIINTYVSAITKVLYDATLYDVTDFSADSLYFDENAYDVINKLADIAGKREWGVGADKKFFFKARSNVITRYYHITEDFINYAPQKDYNPIITKIYLIGSDGYRQTFEVTNKIATREAIVTNAAITTQSVGQQFGRMVLKEVGTPKKSFVAQLRPITARLESTTPLGRAAVNLRIGINEQYDTAGYKYDAGHKYDGGTESYQIEKILYELTDTGVMPTLYFGPVPQGLVDDLGRLNYLINNERISA